MVRDQGWSEHAKKSEPRCTHSLQQAEDRHRWAVIYGHSQLESGLKLSRRLMEPRLFPGSVQSAESQK